MPLSFASTRDEPPGDGVSVELPLARERTWIAVLRWGIALAGLAFVLYLNHNTPDRWLILAYCLMVLQGGVQYLWWAKTKQVLAVSDTTLTITTSRLGLRWAKKYPTKQVSYLRVQQDGPVGTPMLTFDRQDGTSYFGRKLKAAGSRQLLDNVYARYPQLRGMASYSPMPNFPSDEVTNLTR